VAQRLSHIFGSIRNRSGERHAAMWTMLAVGFFNSIMFPAIFSLGVAELCPLTGNGSGLLNMAIVGGAVLPVIQGAIADHFGLHRAFVLPVICYLYILFYAQSGSKANSERYGELRGRGCYWRAISVGPRRRLVFFPRSRERTRTSRNRRSIARTMEASSPLRKSSWARPG